jgi:hypothetical protein
MNGIIGKISGPVLLILPLLGILFIYISWASLNQQIGSATFANVMTLDDIMRFLTGQLEPYQLAARSNFVNAMFERPFFPFNLSVVQFSFAFLGIVIMLAYFYKKQISPWRVIIAVSILVAGLYIYQLFLALSYAFVFSPWEAAVLHSYPRYTYTYLQGMNVFILLFFFINREDSIQKVINEHSNNSRPASFQELLHFGRESLYIIVCVFLGVSFLLTTGYRASNELNNRQRFPSAYAQRSSSIRTERWLPDLLGEQVYLIDQGGQGEALIHIRHELMPYMMLSPYGQKHYSISLWPFYGEGDSWTSIITPDDWERFVIDSGFTMVWVYNTNSALVNIYGYFFQSGVILDMVYRVDVADDKLLLIPIE